MYPRPGGTGEGRGEDLRFQRIWSNKRLHVKKRGVCQVIRGVPNVPKNEEGDGKDTVRRKTWRNSRDSSNHHLYSKATHGSEKKRGRNQKWVQKIPEKKVFRE